jgi:hypothetical protein
MKINVTRMISEIVGTSPLEPVFRHGQFYTALMRGKINQNIKIYGPDMLHPRNVMSDD